MICAVFADKAGNIYDHPCLEMAGRSGHQMARVSPEELISLPEGSRLFFLPGREGIGWDPQGEEFATTRMASSGDRRRRGAAVSAFLPPGYTRTLLPAASHPKKAKILPLWSYTATGWQEDHFVAAAVRTDPVDHSESRHYDDRLVLEGIESRLRESPANRLLRHLARCATEYHCFAAKNLFLARWEAPLPTSPSCNSSCLGCISLQPSDCCPASQERIRFIPSVDEIAGVAVPHLKRAAEGIVSFGQGCEGEPLMVAPLLEQAIQRIRGETDRGTIHLNTNGSDPDAVVRLCRAGLDSIRISLNSARGSLYGAYFRPRGYQWEEVVDSIQGAKAMGAFTAINLLVFPGVTDREGEVEALWSLIRAAQLDMVQVRNLSIDPDLYLSIVPAEGGKCLGIRRLLRLLREEFPRLEIGYFNRPRELFGARLCQTLSL